MNGRLRKPSSQWEAIKRNGRGADMTAQQRKSGGLGPGYVQRPNLESASHLAMNDNAGLEAEADVMGAKALSM